MKNFKHWKSGSCVTLSRSAMKLILGGDPIELRPYDPYCDEVKETEYVPDCPCFADTQCPERRYIGGPPGSVGNIIPGSGYCVDGHCT